MTTKKALEVKQALYGTGFRPTFHVRNPRDVITDEIYSDTLEFDPTDGSANYPDDGWIALKSFEEMYMTIEGAE